MFLTQIRLFLFILLVAGLASASTDRDGEDRAAATAEPEETEDCDEEDMPRRAGEVPCKRRPVKDNASTSDPEAEGEKPENEWGYESWLPLSSLMMEDPATGFRVLVRGFSASVYICIGVLVLMCCWARSRRNARRREGRGARGGAGANASASPAPFVGHATEDASRELDKLRAEIEKLRRAKARVEKERRRRLDSGLSTADSVFDDVTVSKVKKTKSKKKQVKAADSAGGGA